MCLYLLFIFVSKKLVILPRVRARENSPHYKHGCSILYKEDLKNLDGFFRDLALKYSGGGGKVFNTHANRSVFNKLAPLLAAVKKISFTENDHKMGTIQKSVQKYHVVLPVTRPLQRN